MIFSLLNDSFNNNIAVLGSKIMYFCLRPNLCECTTLSEESDGALSTTFVEKFFHKNSIL